MSARSVLVTGGAGYIGSHACKALAARDFAPVTLDNLTRGREQAVRWGPFVHGDIGDREVVDRAFAEHRPVAVLHFAALAYVGESVRLPGDYYRNNVAGTITLLDAMHAHDCRSIVFSSSCATYGIPTGVPIIEAHPQRPINPYGWSKLMVERMLQDHERAWGIRHASLRYFNAAGADADGEIGEAHEPETHLIPLAIQAALGRVDCLEVYGTDYPTADGTAIRDFIHVSDLADVHVLALEHLLEGASVSLNVGTGRGHSVREVIRRVESATGRAVPVRDSPRRAGDPPALVADASKAAATYGWRPQFSIEATIESAVRWERSR